MKFIYYLNEAIEKSPSAVVNKVAAALRKLLPFVRLERPFRLGLGILASTKSTNDVPQTCPGMAKVTGIAVYIDDAEKIATVYEITSADKGMGSKMVEAMLNALPSDYKIAIHHDWSGGWWDKIMKKYSDREWIVD